MARQPGASGNLRRGHRRPHQAEGFRERGLALSLSYNPRPSTPLGFVARVAPSWGGQATSGAEVLWGQETMAGMAPGVVASGTRLDGEVGYGLPVGRRFVGTPTLGVGTSADGRDYRLGYRLGALGGAGTAFELGVGAQRRERPLQGDTDHAELARAHGALVAGGARPARTERVTPTRARPAGLDRVRPRRRRDPCTRDRSPPGRAPPVSPVPPRRLLPLRWCRGSGGQA